ncbi:Glutarate-semialdehyde dehydrogenase DavD, partial [Penicillium rolfsii]
LKDPSLFISDAFIDGKWLKKDEKFEVFEPSTGTVMGRVANCSLTDFQKAIESAHKIQQSFFESSTGTSRGALLRRWHDLIIANKEDATHKELRANLSLHTVATILCLENGKTYAEALGEVVYAASFISWFAEEATRAYGLTIPSSSSRTTLLTFKEPVGVCGIITPWNFPAAMITRKVGPAIAAGCAVVIKPPAETPYTALALTKLAIDAGLPPTLIQVCPTKDHKAASELAVSPLIRKISFTGSTNVGKLLARMASATLKRVSLELGGNAPFIVFDDADIDLAVEAAMFCKFRCSGQTCVCANRLLVQKGIAKEFIAQLVRKVSALEPGPGLDSRNTQGPLVNKAAVDKVAEHVADAVSKGAKIEIGGSQNPSPGYFFTPTVISGVQPQMAVCHEETFGPLAAVVEFESEDEALRLANDTMFGLAGYFFTQNVARTMRLAQRLQVGMVGVNTGKISAAEAPFGGVKESGYGREGSAYGLEEYQEIKSITIGNW